ncbi:hypothetical protein MF6396_26920 [Pseudomonas sp. MF6396]|uniref:phage tail protein n=1 Tax=Pseudomonas sp. MF6396 TaxID=1960828 RepID=UPI0009CC109D|nr:phage tail protein [Pseudomonas sp. MF6396]OOV90952.1 hypothetical protein MF6396_26920 [Pseudomonas sp. MF6396]
MPWYREGTVAIVAGQTTVTGTGTNFAANSRVGDALQGPDGRWYEVTNIVSGTVLSIYPAYQGATIAAGTYGLAPMQGYVKEAADRLRQIVEQFGSTLAVLGGATTAPQLRENIGAAARGANSDITSLTGMTTALSVAQGGTGGSTQATARTGLGLKAAATADIVGTVSQSGGVPTGAIFERGSNTNGRYVKYADGSATAEMAVTTTSFSSVAGLYVSDFMVSPTPITFIAGSAVLSGNDAIESSFLISGRVEPQKITARAYFTSSPGVPVRTINIVVQGRWY